MTKYRIPTHCRLLMIASLVLATMTLAAPTAIAHQCQAEKGEPGESDCSKPCKEGEDHDHSVTHWHDEFLGDDHNHVHYECSSREEEKEPEGSSCSSPRIVGICLISERGVAGGRIALP